MTSLLAAGSGGFPPSLMVIIFFTLLFVGLNVVEKGRWD